MFPMTPRFRERAPRRRGMHYTDRMDQTREAALQISANRERIVDTIMELSYRASPGFWERYGEAGRARGRQDANYHLDYLVEALRYGTPALFASYRKWLETIFAGLGFPADKLVQTMDALGQGLFAALPAELAETAAAYLGRDGDLSGTAAFGTAGAPGPEAGDYLGALLAGDRAKASSIVMKLLAEGMPVKRIYLDVFQACQRELGRLWMNAGISVAQEHFCTAAAQADIARLYPAIFSGPRNGRALVAASVGGELHELGIRMVADFFELDGWESYYLGANAPAAAIVSAIRDRKAALLCLSATTVASLPELDSTIRHIRDALGGQAPKVIVGGGLFNVSPDFWKKVGADGCASDAEEALAVAASLVGR